MLVCSVFTVFMLYCEYEKRSISEVVKDFNNNIVLVKCILNIIWFWLPAIWKISPQAFPFVSQQFIYIFERPAEEVGV
jgi:bacteriorhodopsin